MCAIILPDIFFFKYLMVFFLLFFSLLPLINLRGRLFTRTLTRLELAFHLIYESRSTTLLWFVIFLPGVHNGGWKYLVLFLLIHLEREHISRWGLDCWEGYFCLLRKFSFVCSLLAASSSGCHRFQHSQLI